MPKEEACGAITRDDGVVAGTNDQDGVSDEVKEGSIFVLNPTQPAVIALHELLGFDESALQGSQRAQVATDRDHAAIWPDLDQRKENWNLDAVGLDLVDMTPTRIRLATGDQREHLANLRSALRRDEALPAATNPGPIGGGGPCLGARRDILNLSL